MVIMVSIKYENEKFYFIVLTLCMLAVFYVFSLPETLNLTPANVTIKAILLYVSDTFKPVHTP
jgi:hypothetical protein